MIFINYLCSRVSHIYVLLKTNLTMSKGNMLLGHARGKVGSVVFARLKGQQVTRALNPNPNNPRTASQMYQRALFTDAVKFYTRGRRNLFQFAFEDKKVNESDYNAFMRENAKRGVVISKAAFDNYGYPALGNWLMSKGTLPPVPVNLQSGTDSINIAYSKSGITTELTTVTTLGQLSQLLIDGVDFLAGDILTFVTITAGEPESENIPSVEGDVERNTEWDIVQLQLDANSSQPLSDYSIVATITGTTTKSVVVTPSEGQIDTLIFAGTIIHSRNTSNGVRVSTQELTLNLVAQGVLEEARAREYVDAVVESWRTTQQAPVISESVMQGNIAQSIAADFNAGE